MYERTGFKKLDVRVRAAQEPAQGGKGRKADSEAAHGSDACHTLCTK